MRVESGGFDFFYVMQEEVWKDIPGFDCYQISNRGNVRKTLPNGEFRPIKPFQHKDKYLKAELWKDGKRKKMFVHRLVKDLFSNPEDEIWVDIPGYEGYYQVSSFGRVKSLKRITLMPNGVERPERERIMYQSTTKCGYKLIGLCADNVRNYYCVHRLVAKAFIPNPDNLRCVNHIDENKTNNNVYNLHWCSSQFNNTYGSRLKRVAKSNGKRVAQLDENGNIIACFDSAQDAHRKTGINSSSINAVRSGYRNRQRAGGYKWITI